jgi:hypothetical protein
MIGSRLKPTKQGPGVNESFFGRPILDSPCACPGQHWELDADGHPINHIVESRRRSEVITSVLKPQGTLPLVFK